MSIITGYPMSNAALDAAYEAESARMLEEQQIHEEPVPEMRKLDEQETVEAYAGCVVALDCFEHTLNWIAETIDRAKGTAEADKLASIYDQLSDLKLETKKIKEVWSK